MDLEAQASMVKLLLNEMHAKLIEAERVARAAQACAEAGSISEAVQVSMDLDQLVYEVDRMHDAVTLLGRIVKRQAS